MRFGAIRHVVAHARTESETASVGELCFEFALEAQQEVSLRAPVIRDVTRRVFQHAHAHLAELARAPARLTPRTGVRADVDLAPVDRAEGQMVYHHGAISV